MVGNQTKKTGVLNDGFFSIDSKDRKNKFGFLFEGKIEVPKDGEYEFSLNSDDGSDLRVGGVRVVLNDGLHDMVSKQGKIKLKKGLVEIKVGYFQKTGAMGCTSVGRARVSASKR